MEKLEYKSYKVFPIDSIGTLQQCEQTNVPLSTQPKKEIKIGLFSSIFWSIWINVYFGVDGGAQRWRGVRVWKTLADFGQVGNTEKKYLGPL